MRGPRIISNSGVRFEVRKGIGDETVPVLSAERIGNGMNLNAFGVTPEAFIPDSDEGETDNDVEHTELTKNERVQQRIFEILGLTTQPVIGSLDHQGEKGKMQNGIPQRETNYLLIEGVERLEITDDLGNTNSQINEDFELAVPNVDYTPIYIEGTPNGWYSHDVSMTTTREYTIKFRTGADILDIELVRGIGNESPSYAVRYVDLELPANVDCLLTINSQGMEDLRYDSDGNGTYDTVVPAHVRVTGTAAQDTTAPVVTIDQIVVGNQRRVTVTATDTESGVGTIYYRRVGEPVFQEYTEPFFIPSAEVNRVVEAFADDNVGNRSSPIKVQITP